MIKKIMTICCIFAISASVLAGCGKKAETADQGITIPVWSSAEESSSVSSNTASSSASTSTSTSASTSSAHSVSSEYITTSNYTEFTTNSENAPDIQNNITLITERNFYTADETTITVTVRNRTGWQLSYKNDYLIQKNNDGQWVDVPFVQDPDFGGEVYLLSTGMDGTVTIDLTQLAAKPEIGEYRIGIPMLCNGYGSEFAKPLTIYIK